MTSICGRLEWIDWMKALGIYLVVLGHFYSFGEKFIYVFHIPLFFLISGFLSKKEGDGSMFWKKIWYNLAVPMLIIASLNFIFHCLPHFLKDSFLPIDIYWFVRNIVFGMVSGFDTLWFVYTLILLKIILQYSMSNKLFYSLTVIMLALAYVYNNCDLSGLPFFMNEPNVIANTFTAFPFFALGVYLRKFKLIFNEWNNRAMVVSSFVGSLLLVFCCFLFNDYVAMYRCGYGSDILMFLLGGIAGSMMIFAVSKLFGHSPRNIFIISRGTIVILGFHKLLIDMVRVFFPMSEFDIIFAALIVMLFIPLIIVSEKYFPLIAGIYRVNKSF